MLHCIINPASSSGRGLRQWEAIERCLIANGAEYEAHFSDAAHSIEDIAASLTDPSGKTEPLEDRTLVILGGDGSMNGAVNGIRDFAHTRIGFIPIGSGNDLALDLGLPSDQEALIRTILKEEVVRECDIGRVTFHNRTELLDPFTHMPVEAASAAESGAPYTRLFNISAGIGFDAACCQGAEGSRFKKLLNRIRMGQLVYLYNAVKLILTAPMKPAEIIFTNKKTNRRTRLIKRMLFAVCMNHCYEGGGFRFCPDASASDGMLDTLMAGDLNRLNFFRIFPTAYDGGHLKYQGVNVERSDTVEIRTALPLWVHTDGEVTCKSSHITVDLLPEKLRIIL